MRRYPTFIHSLRWFVVAVMFCYGMAVSRVGAAEFGRVSGQVTDAGGNPLMGATVLLTGSGVEGVGEIGKSVERVFTDSRGIFSIDHVAPGWYSLQVLSAARLPAMRTGVKVMPDATTRESFALGNIFSHVQWQDPKAHSGPWVNEWKWILRTSASTRPILQFQKAKESTRQAVKRSLFSGTHVVAMIPGPAPGDALAGDQSTGTVVAYLHPLNENSDVLVAGSTGVNSSGTSSFSTAYRKGLKEKNREEITLSVHRLNLANGLPAASGPGLADSEGMVLRYTQIRQLSKALTLTAGVEIRYLKSVQDTGRAHPQVSLAYRLDPQTLLTMSYGTVDAGQASSLLGRVSDLSVFPRVTLENYRPVLEDATHAEVRVDRSLGAHSSVEVAAYHDAFRDVAVWAIGGVSNLNSVAAQGNVLFRSGGAAAVLNGGRYGSSGVRAAYFRRLGHHVQMGFMYAVGDALDAGSQSGSFDVASANDGGFSRILNSELTQSFSGKLSSRIPKLGTQVITTYTWLPAGRVTLVDPYGEGRMELQPFLGLNIRQPLPKIDALPIRIVAMADFRNLLGQGAVPLIRSSRAPTFLTPAYRTVRGGFAVQF